MKTNGLTRWTVALLLIAGLAGCARAFMSSKQEVLAQVEQTMGAFASMDLEGFKSGLAEDVTAFEMDLDGKPVKLASRDEAVRFANGIFAEMKKRGGSMKLYVHSTECRVGTMLAWCIVEFEFKANLGDGSTIVRPTRNTIVLRRDRDGWKWTHWHSSLSAAPASAP